LDFTVSVGVSAFRLWLITHPIIGFKKHTLTEVSGHDWNKERNIQYDAGNENKWINLKNNTKNHIIFCNYSIHPTKNPNLPSQKLLVLFVILSPDLNVQHILPVREVVKIKLFPPLRICTLTQCLENMQL